jgi:glyoxylase-like metal-dependent hydrolase (beta-lactamase superfamily II)
MKLGGGGAQPGAAPQNQNTNVTENSGFEQKLQIWFTPHGFLNLAADNAPSVTVQNVDGTIYNVVSFDVADGEISHPMRGYFNTDTDVLERVETEVDNPVYGDLVIEARFGNYQDFDGVRFPASYVHRQGGFDTLNLTVDNVVPNSTAAAAPREAAGGGGGRGGRGGGAGGAGAAPDAPPPYTELGDGIFVLDGGYQAVAVEFAEYSLVIDGLQNEQRAADIIALTKEIIPGKPIRYWLTTHMHFDHIGGIREVVAEGATIVTHEGNAAFLEEVLDNPRTMNPDRLSAEPAAAAVEGAGDIWVLDDGTNIVELYKIEGSLHADDMMIAYLPSINAIVEADLAQPWMNPVFGGAGHPFLVHLADELDRIGIAYDQFVPIHRPTPGPTVSREDFLALARP